MALSVSESVGSGWDTQRSFHGPMVWALCQRLLHHHADAEEAFQATFLTLFQHAAKIQKQTSLASWLYGVACRIAYKIKRTRVRAQQRELRQARPEEQAAETSWDQAIRDIMDAELARLPAHYREPLLLCYLQGQSQALAAQTLGWPIGTVAGRLSRAKELLRSRLIRRGVAPAVAAGMSFDLAQAHLPSELLEKTLQTIHTGGTSTVSLLTKGAVTTMWITKWLTAGAIGITLTLGAGWCYSAFSMQGEGKKETGAENQPLPVKQTTEPSEYQLIQGQWRCEIRHEVTGTLQGVEDLTFRGKKYAKSIYGVEKGAIGERGYESAALDYVLDSNQSPKRMELQQIDPKTTQLNIIGGGVDNIDRLLCTYELKGDVLTINYGGHVPFIVNPQGKIVSDRNSPLATFPKPGDPNVKTLVYHRQTPANKVVEKNEQTQKVISERERILLEEQVKACEEVVKLRLQTYKAGKETINFLLDAIKHRAEVKLDLAGNNATAIQAALNEALDSAKEVEAITNAKFKAGSVTFLEVTTTKVERLHYELQLLRLDKSTK